MQTGYEKAILLAALTLEERRRYCILPRRPSNDSETKLVSERLKVWRKYFAREDSDPEAWKHFLTRKALSEVELSRLAQPIDITDGSPLWIGNLRAILRDMGERYSRPRYRKRLAESLAFPVAKHAAARFFQSLPSSMRNMIPAVGQSSLRDCLLVRLANTIRRVANWEFHIFRITPGLIHERLQDGGPEASIKLFFSAGVETEVIGLLRSYPALARLWAVQVTSWGQFAAKFLQHTQTFLYDTVHGSSENGRAIAAFGADCSDLHEGNQSVMRLRMSDGAEWFYKPRSGELERAWFNLLRWLNDEGFAAPFKILRVVLGERHYWMEGVTPLSCSTLADAATYYFRAGAILFLAHILRGVDFHAGNIIAHGPHPVIVDCETLLHPVGHASNKLRPEEGSVLRTGMLPMRIASEGGEDGVSALGRRTLGPHTVRLKGRSLHVSQFVEEVVDGFERMRAFLYGNRIRRAAFRTKLKRFHALQCRHIHRPTAHYYSILNYSLSPHALKSGLERDILLNAACRHSAVATRYLSSEVRALENGDIPVFRGKTVSAIGIDSDESMRDSIPVIREACAPTADQCDHCT